MKSYLLPIMAALAPRCKDCAENGEFAKDAFMIVAIIWAEVGGRFGSVSYECGSVYGISDTGETGSVSRTSFADVWAWVGLQNESRAVFSRAPRFPSIIGTVPGDDNPGLVEAGMYRPDVL